MDMNLQDLETLKKALGDTVKVAVNKGTENLEKKIDKLQTVYEKDQENFKDWKNKLENEQQLQQEQINNNKEIIEENKKYITNAKKKTMLISGSIATVLTALIPSLKNWLSSWINYLFHK